MPPGDAQGPLVFGLTELQAAAGVIRTHSAALTRRYTWPLLAERTGAEVWVKHENHLPTGAFKVRGGVVLADRLRRESADIRGLISATRGNHGQSLPSPAAGMASAVTIVVPLGNSAEKNAAMAALGATLVEHGVDFEDAREEAHRRAEAAGLLFVPSFAPGSGQRRCNLCVGIVPGGRRPRCRLCADRPGFRHLRHDPGPRPAGPVHPDHRRAEHRRRLLCPILRGRPSNRPGNRADT